jgi:hypothetical protein
MTRLDQVLRCDDGDAVRVSFRNMTAVMFHVERIAYGSAMIRVETWTGESSVLRLWPGDQAAVESGNGRHLAAVMIIEDVDDGQVLVRVASPIAEAGGVRVRLRGVRLGQSRIRRVPDPDRMIPLPQEQARRAV